MPIPQYNVRQTDTGSRNYNQPAFRPAPAPPKVNPLKNWWNNIVNNARQNAYAPVNTWDTVAPNVPTFNTSTQRTPWDIPYWTPPSVRTPLPQPTYSVFDPFGITQNTGMNMPNTMPNTMPTVYGTNTRRGSNTGLNARQMLLMQIYGTPAGEDYDQYDIGGPQQKYLNGVESLESLIARGAVDPYGHDPYEVGGSPYEYYPAVKTPELPPYQPGGGGYGGYGGGGSYDYFSRPSSPSYTGYGSSYYSLPNSSGSRGGGNGYYSLPSSPGYSGYGGGGGYYSMPAAPSAANYSGGNNRVGAPAATYYRGINSGGGYGGGYAGGQSQRSAWYGALLQWNI